MKTWEVIEHLADKQGKLQKIFLPNSKISIKTVKLSSTLEKCLKHLQTNRKYPVSFAQKYVC